MTQPCWNNLYFHNSFMYNFYFGSKGRGEEENVCGQGSRALGHQEKSFYYYFFFRACKYVCATWESHRWSKLNAEFSLFYLISFTSPWLFVEEKKPLKSSLTPVVRFLSVGSSACLMRGAVLVSSWLHLNNMSNSSLMHLYSTSYKKFEVALSPYLLHKR